MVKNYTITKKSQFASMFSLVWLFAMFTGAAIIIYFRVGSTATFTFFIPGFLILYIVQVIFLMLIHSSYYSVNKGDELICDYDSKLMIYHHKGKVSEIRPFEIASVKNYMSYPMKNKTIGSLAWDDYNYCEIELMNGQSIIITSLLVSDMNFFLENMNIDNNKITRIAKLFNTIETSNS